MTDPHEHPELTDEELAALQAEIDKLQVEDLVLQMMVSLIDLGMRKAPDWEQVRAAIEATRALLPIVEPKHGDKLAPVREALSQMQMAYVRNTQGKAAEEPSEPGEQGPGPAQSSGRLWVPGQ